MARKNYARDGNIHKRLKEIDNPLVVRLLSLGSLDDDDDFDDRHRKLGINQTVFH